MVAGVAASCGGLVYVCQLDRMSMGSGNHHTHGDPVRHTNELGNSSRNERQKSMLLCEVSKLRCSQIAAAIEDEKRIIENSKNVCERAGHLT